MVKGYKDLIRVLKQDGEDKKVEFTAYAVLSFYYNELLNDSNSLDMKWHYEELIDGILIGLRFTRYISEDVFYLLKDEVFRLVYN